MNTDNLTANNMQLNEVEPNGFTSAPRVLSHEVAIVREQVTALLTAVGQLVELQSEVNKKLDAALSDNPIKTEAVKNANLLT